MVRVLRLRCDKCGVDLGTTGGPYHLTEAGDLLAAHCDECPGAWAVLTAEEVP